jgi:glycosyltransferase involved in cell wall biosynthesis
MISVLIPVYNFDVRQLVGDLHEQLSAADVPFEIICLDDGSAETFKIQNRALLNPSTPQPLNPSTLHYEELQQNLGRARIRNLLAEKAQYPHLLFMDCDSKVGSPHYIQNYLDHLQPSTLLYGGRSYAPRPPKAAALYFHWLYGTRREVRSATERAKQPYHSFMTNNFLIPKAVFEPIKFEERLTQYGHEDTLFGMELQKRQVQILHLDNPLEHIGLEDVEVFLRKTEQGVRNLAFLSTQYPELNTKLLRTYRALRRRHLERLVANLLRPFAKRIIQNLKSRQPSLRLFDLYKLHLFIEAKKRAVLPDD